MKWQKPGLHSLIVCLVIFLTASVGAQTSSPKTDQQPAAAAQTQGDQNNSPAAAQNSQTPAIKKDDTDKNDKEDREPSHKMHVRLGDISVGAGYSRGPFF